MTNEVAMPTAIPTTHEDDEQRHLAVATRCLMSKVTWRLIPFLVLLEICAYINRVSIGHAKIMGIQTDINLSVSEMNWAVSIFYLSYLIFNIPNIILFRFLGPARYLSFSMISWGVLLVGMAFVRNSIQLIAVRFLLGMTEAGFFPGTIIYLSYWYPRREQIMRIAIFFAAAAAACALGALLAHGITHMEGIGGLHDWQWLFFLEGVPMIPIGIITYLFFGKIPETVQWLNNTEQMLLARILREDAGVMNPEKTPTAWLSWTQVRYAFTDWQVYLYGLIAVGISTLLKSLVNYLPSIIEAMDIVKEEVHLMIVLPYVLACLSCLLIGSSSSRHYQFGLHLIFTMSITLVGFVLMAILGGQSKAGMYLSACVACSGVFASLPVLLSWVTNNVGGYTKRAIAIAFVMGIGQIGGILAPEIFREGDKPTYRRGHIICIAIATATLVATLVLRFCLARENHRRKHLYGEMKQREEAVNEPCDRHPGFRYRL